MWRRNETIGNQEWPERRGLARVLVEDPDGAEQWARTSILTQAGYDVAACRGPGATGPPRCPLVEQGTCAMAEGADVVLSSLPVTQRASREVIRSLRTRLPDTPVVVEAPHAQATLYADALEGCQVEATPLTQGRLRQVVATAIQGRPA